MSPIYEDHRSTRYEPPVIDLENKNNSQVLLIELIGAGKNILEVGTSTGYVSRILKERGNTVTGIEIDPGAGEIAGQHCDSMFIGDIEKLDLDAYLAPSSFDVIIFGDVLEHLVSPEDVLRKVKKYLRPDGFLAISLPNVCHGDVILNLFMGDFKYTSMGLLDATHLRFFGLRNIIDLFSRCGYSITDIRTTVLPVGGTEQRVDPGLVPEDLANFVKSLPNSSVYQYVFTASPSPGPGAVEAAPAPDLEGLFRGAIEGSIQAETKPLLEELSAYEVRIASFDEQIKQLIGKSESLQKAIAERDAQVASLNEQITLSDEILRSLKKVLADRDAQIASLDEQTQQQAVQLVHLSNELASMKQSVVWQLLMKFHSGFVERILPQNTRRRKLYTLGLVGLRVLIHEGPGSLWMHGKRRLGNKFRLRLLNLKEPVLRISLEAYDGNVPLPLDNPLMGRFISPTNELHAIEVLTETYERRNADLRLSIREGSPEGRVVREALLKGSRIINNGYSWWGFKPIPDSKEKVYYFQIESTGSPSAAVWYNSTPLNEKLQLFRDGNEINGQIGFQCFTKEAIRDPYRLWILQNDPSEAQLEQMRKECVTFSYRPKISIVTPVWNTDERWLRRAIESVLEQTYDNWELCIADGGSTRESVERVLKEYAEKDSRIKVKSLDENKGISGNSNEALSLAAGDFIGLLDHDDELAPFALCEVVKLLNKKRHVSFIYSDEDKIDEKRRRNNPFFKPDWSPDTFFSHNYICHFSVIKRELVQRVGGFREGYDGSQDYDLFLRVTETLDEREIAHIPKILYHWRTIQGSAADNVEAKPYAIVAAKKALANALYRRGIKASVLDGPYLSSYRVRYEITGNPKVSIIIPTKDKVGVLQTCVNSILEMTDYENYEVVIVDNQSREPETHDYYQRIKNNPHVKVLEYDSPFNFSAINNFAVAHADGEYLVLLNNDTEIVAEEWLTAMLEHAQREEVGAVGAKLLYYNNTIQHAGVVLGITGSPGEKGVAGHSHKHLSDRALGYFLRPHIIGNVSAVTAACMMVRRDVYEQVGGLEEDLVVAFNDVDFCLKIRDRGYLIVYTPYAKLYHYESLSRGYEDNPEKQARFLKEVRYVREKWGGVIDTGDPYYNPNLTLEREDFSANI